MALSRYLPSAVMPFRFILANRTNYLLQVVGELLPLVVILFVWQAAYAQAPVLGGLDHGQMITYIFVAQFFRIVANYPENEWQIGYWIRSGDLVRQLILPLRFIGSNFFGGLGRLAAVSGLSGGLLLLIGILFFGVALPPLRALPALLVSLCLALAISFGFSYLIAAASFWTDGATWGLSTAKGVILSFTSGALIPLALFPDWLRTLAGWLPFQAAVHTPTAIYLGQLQGAPLWRALGLQALWAAALLLLADWCFNYGLRKMTIPGG